jgi:hypothetical protein
VGIQPTTTTGNYRTFSTSPAQSIESLLASDDTGMLCDDVERVLEDVESGGRCAMECGFKGIDLFITAIGLDNRKLDGCQP